MKNYTENAVMEREIFGQFERFTRTVNHIVKIVKDRVETTEVFTNYAIAVGDRYFQISMVMFYNEKEVLQNVEELLEIIENDQQFDGESISLVGGDFDGWVDEDDGEIKLTNVNRLMTIR